MEGLTRIIMAGDDDMVGWYFWFVGALGVVVCTPTNRGTRYLFEVKRYLGIYVRYCKKCSKRHESNRKRISCTIYRTGMARPGNIASSFLGQLSPFLLDSHTCILLILVSIYKIDFSYSFPLSNDG